MKLDTKKRSLPLASSDDKNMEEQEPTEIMIKTNKSAHDDQSCSTMTASHDLGSILRKNFKKKVSETSITGNTTRRSSDLLLQSAYPRAD